MGGALPLLPPWIGQRQLRRFYVAIQSSLTDLLPRLSTRLFEVKRLRNKHNDQEIVMSVCVLYDVMSPALHTRVLDK
jgi:hypothetical protein